MSTHLYNDNLIRANRLRATTGHPDGTVLGDGPPSSTPAHQRRILAKLATLWAAQPGASYCDIITQVYTLTNERWVGDDEIERTLDEALNAVGLTVTGGWKS